MSISALAAVDRPLTANDPAPPVARAAEVAELSAAAGHKLFGPDGITFGSILDAINPLQHLPVVSTIYRSLTGESISPGSRMIGGALFGGVFGFASAVVNAIVESDTGKDVGAHLMALFDGGSGGASETKVAQAAAWVDPDTLPGPLEVAAGPVAKPWVDPDLQPESAAATSVAPPWIDPDLQPVQAAAAPAAKPWVDPDRQPVRVAQAAKPAIPVDRPWFDQVQQPLAAEAARRAASATSAPPAIASRHPVALAAQGLLAAADGEAAPRKAAAEAAGAYSQRVWFPARPAQVDFRR